MSFPAVHEDAAVELAEATEDAVTWVPMTVTIETDDGSPPEVMYVAALATAKDRRSRTLYGAALKWMRRAAACAPGEGPLCVACDVEFGPGQGGPAAFHMIVPFVKTSSKLVLLSAICGACFNRADLSDRIVDAIKKISPPDATIDRVME